VSFQVFEGSPFHLLSTELYKQKSALMCARRRAREQSRERFMTHAVLDGHKNASQFFKAETIS